MPQLRLLGAGREVGRSCIRLDINNHHFLLDCGIDPAATGPNALPDFTGTSVENLDAVFVSHAHLDHTGAIPELVRRGFKGKVFMTLPTLALVKLLWQDELSIMEREWPKEDRLWSSKEMHQVLNKLAVPTTYHEVFKLDSISVNFHNAGHILGSTMTEITYKGFRLVYSGDLGTSSNHLRYWRTEDLVYPDVLICEGTYGGKNRKSREETGKEFIESVRSTVESGGKILIPTFSVGKAQEILKILKDSWNKIPNVEVYLEGMAIETLRIYEQFLIYMDDKVRRAYLFNNINPFRWEALRTFKSISERKRLYQRDCACIILAPSGMLRGGWSVWHMIKMAEDEKNLIALCGHMEEGTTGHQLMSGIRNFTLRDMLSKESKEVNVRCKVAHFDISAHAMHNELCNYISRIKPERLVLVHGDEESLKALAESVKQHTGEIIMPSVGETVDLEHRPLSSTQEVHVEVPISQSTSIIVPKGFSMRVKHHGKERFMRAEDIRSLLNSK
ncbi:MAG: MBL fold metallo-hydrolase [Candidatus Methanosuratincola sp.]|jgi:predicted metal-dependent RNase|nr:MBL fold metallo-hydrolase [Candidatus Methanosuratincola sp.]RWX73763.1 MAG: hypothetical protein Metus_0542 [Candidatus Methanosuratincola subterraneus]